MQIKVLLKGYVPGVSLIVFTNPESTDPVEYMTQVQIAFEITR